MRHTDGGDWRGRERTARQRECDRPVCGRKQLWLFADTPVGAHASAVIYSLIETARANGLEPYTWLRRVLHGLPAAPSVDAIEALLPWNHHRSDLASEMAP